MKSKNILMKLIDKIPIEYELLLIALICYSVAGWIGHVKSEADGSSYCDKKTKIVSNCTVECHVIDPSIFIFNN